MINRSLSTILAYPASTLGAFLLLRFVKRSFSPVKTEELSCACGKIKGTVSAKTEDSLSINCYCQDCRDYAAFVASQGNTPNQCKLCSPLIQVCKNAVTITEGQDLLQLARKGDPEDKENKQLYMHRYYSKCCGVPLMNTVSFLGFVGIFKDRLSQKGNKFGSPLVRLFDNEALPGTKFLNEADMTPLRVLDFNWKLIRYMAWRSAGPFDYMQEPVYWGKNDEKKSL